MLRRLTAGSAQAHAIQTNLAPPWTLLGRHRRRLPGW